MIHHLRVRLVSPLILGGADPDAFDRSKVLRPPSVRGALRFWTRALARDDPRVLETELWGSTEVGQRVALLGAARLWPAGPAVAVETPLFPNNPGKARSMVPMVAPPSGNTESASDLMLRFRLPPVVADEGVFPRLQAVVWTWLHLGSVGRRARRGYGSLLWVPTAGPGDLLNGFLDGGFQWARDLAGPDALASYLRRGLAAVECALGAPSATATRASSDWFRLTTIDQVFVGKQLAKAYSGQPDGMEDTLHGLRVRGGGRPAVDHQLGNLPGAADRLASPMLWRVFPVAAEPGKGFLPVMTWSPREGVTALEAGTALYDYLHGKLGFCRSLAAGAPAAPAPAGPVPNLAGQPCPGHP